MSPPPAVRTWRTASAAGATALSRGLAAGLLSGALIGGGGGRLAMFVLRLTSDATLRGQATDDGFRIGALTAATLFLVIATTLIGVAGGVLYVAVRDWLPPHARPALFGLFGATLGGARFINPDGVDFTRLSPRGLATGLFILLPAAYGVAVSRITEQLVRSPSWTASWWRWLTLLPLGLLLISGPSGWVVIVVIGMVIGAGRWEVPARLWHSGPITWLGRTLFALATLAGAVLLTHDLRALL